MSDHTARTRGRDRFRRVKPLLNGLTALFRLVPRRGIVVLWAMVDWMPGIVGVGLRYAMLRRMAASCGDNVYVGRNVEIRAWDKLAIGSNVSIHRTCYIDATGGITIGNDVSIAHQCSFIAFEHAWNDPETPIRDHPVEHCPITVGSDVWFGCGCRVLGGSRIGDRVIVAAGAVVNRELAGHAIYGGVPARELKKI